MSWFLKIVVGKYGQSVIRHVLTAAAGWLVAIGIPEAQVQAFADSAHPVVLAAIIYGSTQLWSLVDKKDK